MISQNLNVDLRFKENLETSAIVATDNITLTQEVPDTLKNYITVPATNFSSNGATYQYSSLSRFVSADNFFIETTSLATVAGKTIAPVNGTGTAAHTGVTPPYLFWPGINCGCDQGAINKSINQITYNISGKQWIETRQDSVEMVDLWLAQMDQEKLLSYGIVPLKDANYPLLRRLYGNGYVSHTDLVDAPVAGAYSVPTAIPGYAQVGACGFSSALQPENQDDNNIGVWAINARYGYITTKPIGTASGVQSGVKYYSNTTPNLQGSPTPLQAITSEIYGASVLLPSADGTTIFYSNDLYLIQVMPITIREYLISNTLACSAYSKNPYSRALPTAGQLFSIQTYFDTNYLSGMIKMTPPMMAGAFTVNAHTPANSQIISIVPVASQLSFYTFDTKKKLATDSLRMLYYGLNKQTVSNPPSIGSTQAGVKVVGTQLVSSTRTSLDNYMYISLSTKVAQNIATYLNYIASGGATTGLQTLNGTCSNIYHQIVNLNIRYGTDNDVFMGASVPISEAVNLTMKV